MKKAFTMIELVFVIVVVGILSAMIAPNFQRNSLREAADQLISHIRYTQHLAMMDDKYDTNDNEWYKGRWQLIFVDNNNSGNQWTYTVFSDWKGTHTGSPNKATATERSEYAYNPIDSTKYLTCGDSGNNIVHYGDSEVSNDLCLKDSYGIEKVNIAGGGGTTTNTNRIVFDNLGRPYRGNSRYFNSPTHRLAESQIQIALCNKSDCSDKNITIAIEPETGYAHIL